MTKTEVDQCDYSAITTPRTADSPLLRLSGELRNEIYYYVLGADTYIFLNEGFERVTNTRKNRLAILRTCRQIHEEAALLPFSLNLFHFTWLDTFRNFFTQMDPAKRDAVRMLYLNSIYEGPRIERCLLELEKRGYKSLSELLPSIQRLRVKVDRIRVEPDAGDGDANLRGHKSILHMEKGLEHWLRSGLREHVKVEMVADMEV